MAGDEAFELMFNHLLNALPLLACMLGIVVILWIATEAGLNHAIVMAVIAIASSIVGYLSRCLIGRP